MGGALLVAALLMLSSMIGLIPSGGTARAFAPAAFAVAIAASVVFGALLTIGIGNYAPSLIVFSLLGVDPRAAFPIMMGSGAFVATVAGVRFIRAGRFDRRAALGLTAGRRAWRADRRNRGGVDVARGFALAGCVGSALRVIHAAAITSVRRGGTSVPPASEQATPRRRD